MGQNHAKLNPFFPESKGAAAEERGPGPSSPLYFEHWFEPPITSFPYM